MSIADFGPAGWPLLLSNICLFLFYMALYRVMIVRPAPAARSDGMIPSLVAFAGSYLPWTIPLFAPANASGDQSLAAGALLLIGTSLMVFIVCHLSRSFSVVPQARRLVRAGPYAIVRNPMYLAEEITLLGVLLQYYSPLTLLVLIAHGAFQIRRIFYEEHVLRHSFPDYDEYARSTPRLIPCIW